jgi:predicted kinase
MPPVVYLLCGLTGSGKTTHARQLEAAGAVRLSVDEVVEELRRRLVELIESGNDVALDHGLWRRSDRDAYKRLIEAHGGTWRLLHLKADRDLLPQRLADRSRRGDANAMPLTPSDLEDFITRFEEPTGEGEELVQP